MAAAGHLAFLDGNTDHLIIFGGQTEEKFTRDGKHRVREMSNTIMIYDKDQGQCVENIFFTEATVAKRMYCSGFMID